MDTSINRFQELNVFINSSFPVALNYQTEGSETYLNQCRFMDNGGCGYVLKPKCLLEGDFNPKDVNESSQFVEPTELEIRVSVGSSIEFLFRALSVFVERRSRSLKVSVITVEIKVIKL